MTPVSSYADVLAIEKAETLELSGSTYEAIRRSAQAHPEAPALTFLQDARRYEESETLCYRDLLARITQTANAFSGLGIGRDDVVAYVLPNLPETHFTIWGGEAVGVVAALNPLLEPAALASLMAAVKAKVLVTIGPVPGLDGWERLRPELTAVPSLEHVVLIDTNGAPQTARGPETAFATHDFSELIAREPDDRLTFDCLPTPDDRASLFCTGGTTGAPKVAVRRHRCELANAAMIGRFLGGALGPGKTLFCGLPLFHVNGVIVTGLLPFSCGAHVVLGTPQGYRGAGVIENFWKIVAHHRINFFSGVPTLYASLLQVPVAGADVSSLEYGMCGAAPMPTELFRAFQHRTGLGILEGYGLTEAACVSSINPPAGERRIGSIGLRLPWQQMKTVALDETGRYVRDCDVGEIGAIVLRGPNVFDGYLSEEHNRALWIEGGDGRRWLDTGDLGRMDAEGYFWLTGRKKELIIRGGHNIDPAAIEGPLHEHPAVLLAAAVGRPDLHAGELPVAYVQLKPNAAATEQGLAEFARARIGERAAVPKHIRIVEKIPLTPVGKVFKPDLKRREIEAALAEALTQAGVAFKSLRADISARGAAIAVELHDSSVEAGAHRALAGYPFAVEISTAADARRS